MIALQTVRSLASFNIPFFGTAPKDDLVTRAAKVAYRILEYLFGLIEKGVDYLMHDIEPEPFHIRYKWSIRITLVALSVFGVYMGSRHIKNKMTKYLDSFIPDFLKEGGEKISQVVEWILATDRETNPEPHREEPQIFKTNPESRREAQPFETEIINSQIRETIRETIEDVIRVNDINSEEIEIPESSPDEVVDPPAFQKEEDFEFSLVNLEKLRSKANDTYHFGKALTINGFSDLADYVTESRLYYLLGLITDSVINIQKEGNRQVVNLFSYTLEKSGISDTKANDVIGKVLSTLLVFLGAYKLSDSIYRRTEIAKIKKHEKFILGENSELQSRLKKIRESQPPDNQTSDSEVTEDSQPSNNQTSDSEETEGSPPPEGKIIDETTEGN